MEKKWSDNDRFIKKKDTSLFGWRAAALNEDMEPHFHMNEAQVETHARTTYSICKARTHTIHSTNPHQHTPSTYTAHPHAPPFAHTQSPTYPLTHSTLQTHSRTRTPSTLDTHLPPHPFINTFLSKAKEKALQL